MNEGHEEKSRGWWQRVKGHPAMVVSREVLETVMLAKGLWEIGEWVKGVGDLVPGG